MERNPFLSCSHRLRGAHNLVNVVVAGSNKAHDAGNIALLMSSTCFVNVSNETELLVFFDTYSSHSLISLLMIRVVINLSCRSRFSALSSL